MTEVRARVSDRASGSSLTPTFARVISFPRPLVLVDLSSHDSPPETASALDWIAHVRPARHFDPGQTISNALLERILRSATFAPSSYNLQPWRFVVVRSARNRETLRSCAYGQAKITEAPVVLIAVGYHNPDKTDLETLLAESLRVGDLTRATAAAIRGQAPRAPERLGHRALWSTRWTVLAIANLIIAAESVGVASAAIEEFDPQKVRAAFGIPDDHTLCCLVVLGYATERETSPFQFGLDHICYKEHFGQPWALEDEA
jgi:nitroreductase